MSKKQKEASGTDDQDVSRETKEAIEQKVELASQSILGTFGRFRMDQNFGNNIGIKKPLIHVPVRRPNRQEFVRVHPDPSFSMETAVYESAEDRETYLVEPDLLPELADEVKPKILVTAITRENDVFLWPIGLPQPDGKQNDWNRTALIAAENARKEWVRVASNRRRGVYEISVAGGDFTEPVWPDATFEKILEVAFKEYVIASLDHPLIQKLKGKK